MVKLGLENALYKYNEKLLNAILIKNLYKYLYHNDIKISETKRKRYHNVIEKSESKRKRYSNISETKRIFYSDSAGQRNP